MAKIGLTDLEKDANGNIASSPLLGRQHMPVAGTACFLKLDYAESEEQLRSGLTKAVQLVMSPEQARLLAEDLARMARDLLAQKPESSAH